VTRLERPSKERLYQRTLSFGRSQPTHDIGRDVLVLAKQAPRLQDRQCLNALVPVIVVKTVAKEIGPIYVAALLILGTTTATRNIGDGPCFRST